MAHINSNYLNIKESYLFSEVAKRAAKFKEDHPDADVIRLGIGDVTRPLVPAVIESLHSGVDDMADGDCNGKERCALCFDDLTARGFDELLNLRFVRCRIPMDLADQTGIIAQAIIRYMVIGNRCERPRHKRAITMLAVDVRMDVFRADAETARKLRLQAVRIEHSAAADYMMLRNAGDFMENVS